MAEKGPRSIATLPSALDRFPEIEANLAGKRPAVFLDYDGTLTPIVEHPAQAVLPSEMRQTLRQLAALCPVAVVSGRDLPDVQSRVALDELYYAGSHGFDIAGPAASGFAYQHAKEFLPVLDQAEKELRREMETVPGALVDRKKFSVAIHYRSVPPPKAGEVEKILDEVRARHSGLRKSAGKKIFELQPGIEWDKGKAVRKLQAVLEADKPGIVPVYLGDDVTDEDAFRQLADGGLGIVVGGDSRPTAARFRLADSEEVLAFLRRLLSLLR